jgi:hypothetical protein
VKAYVLQFPQGGRLVIHADESRVHLESTINDTKILITVEPDIAREIADAITEISQLIKVAN